MKDLRKLAENREFKVSVYINTCLRAMSPATRIVAAKTAGKAIAEEVAERFAQAEWDNGFEIVSLLDQARRLSVELDNLLYHEKQRIDRERFAQEHPDLQP